MSKDKRNLEHIFLSPVEIVVFIFLQLLPYNVLSDATSVVCPV